MKRYFELSKLDGEKIAEPFIARVFRDRFIFSGRVELARCQDDSCRHIAERLAERGFFYEFEKGDSVNYDFHAEQDLGLAHKFATPTQEDLTLFLNALICSYRTRKNTGATR